MILKLFGAQPFYFTVPLAKNKNKENSGIFFFSSYMKLLPPKERVVTVLVVGVDFYFYFWIKS